VLGGGGEIGEAALRHRDVEQRRRGVERARLHAEVDLFRAGQQVDLRDPVAVGQHDAVGQRRAAGRLGGAGQRREGHRRLRDRVAVRIAIEDAQGRLFEEGQPDRFARRIEDLEGALLRSLSVRRRAQVVAARSM
jgi:hypothetical protein